MYLLSYKICVIKQSKCITQRTPINLHPNEYSQELHYHLFEINLDRWAGSCNTLDNLSNKVSVPNKTKDLNLHVFDMITVINESRTLTKYISSKCECKLYTKKCN